MDHIRALKGRTAGDHTLAHGLLSLTNQTMLIGDYPPICRGPLQKFASSQEELRPPRTTQSFLSHSKGLVDQQAPRLNRRQNAREERAMQVIADQDGGEELATKRPGLILQVRPQQLQAAILRPGRILTRIEIDGCHRETCRQERAAVPPRTAGQVQD